MIKYCKKINTINNLNRPRVRANGGWYTGHDKAFVPLRRPRVLYRRLKLTKPK
jgi:hypothetical protein